jgi:hypothetical protein
MVFRLCLFICGVKNPGVPEFLAYGREEPIKTPLAQQCSELVYACRADAKRISG